MGSNPKINWEQAFEQWLSHKLENPKATQKAFAVSIGLDVEYLSTRFTEIRTKRLLDTSKGLFPKLLKKSLAIINNTLNEDADYSTSADRTGISPEFKGKFALETAKAMADRLGMSPQAMTVNLNQNNLTVMQAPIFAAQYEDLTNSMFPQSKVIDADKSSDSETE